MTVWMVYWPTYLSHKYIVTSQERKKVQVEKFEFGRDPYYCTIEY